MSSASDSTNAPAGREQVFFDDPAVDRVLGLAMALATEVWVLRDRVRALENALAEAGVVDSALLDAEPDDAERAASAADRAAFVEALMVNLTGEAASAHEDPGHG